MSNSTLKILPVLMIAIAAALVTQPVRAVPIVQTLDITETSSTTLTAVLTVNGTKTSLNVSGSADSWTIDLTGVSGPGQQWTEPDAAGFFNLVAPPLPGEPDLIIVRSDFSSLSSGLANNATDKTDFILSGVELDVTFHDNGDVATVPDTGSTLGLLSLSAVALLGATRLRFLQLAA